jgi:hypothetical protein
MGQWLSSAYTIHILIGTLLYLGKLSRLLHCFLILLLLFIIQLHPWPFLPSCCTQQLATKWVRSIHGALVHHYLKL